MGVAATLQDLSEWTLKTLIWTEMTALQNSSFRS